MFDREHGDSSVYERVHNEFVELVSTLIDSYAEDVGIDITAFKKVLEEALNKEMAYKERVGDSAI